MSLCPSWWMSLLQETNPLSNTFVSPARLVFIIRSLEKLHCSPQPSFLQHLPTVGSNLHWSHYASLTPSPPILFLQSVFARSSSGSKDLRAQRVISSFTEPWKLYKYITTASTLIALTILMGWFCCGGRHMDDDKTETKTELKKNKVGCQ